MPKTIDDATYEDTIRRQCYVPGAHERPQEAAWNRSAWTDDSFTANDLADLGDSAREFGDEAGAELLFGSRGPINMAPVGTTKPSMSGLGFWLAGGTLAAVAVVALLANWWPEIVAWSYR